MTGFLGFGSVISRRHKKTLSKPTAPNDKINDPTRPTNLTTKTVAHHWTPWNTPG